MNILISKRNFVRIITFSIAILAVFIALFITNNVEKRSARQQLHNAYSKSLTELSLGTDNIKTWLSKAIYTGTPEGLNDISTKLWLESANAKAALSSLPLNKSELTNINRFLSQVGNYALSLSKKTNENSTPSDKEYENLKKLHEYSTNLSKKIWLIDKNANMGLSEIKQTKSMLMSDNIPSPPSVVDGFTTIEGEVQSYPKLIYDGPFSDHILEKKPKMLENQKPVSKEVAQGNASKYLNIPASELVETHPEAGKMPSYCFEKDNTRICVTKAGGYVSYMLKNRNVKSTDIDLDKALFSANQFLKKNGYENLETTYYETVNNICTINFAGLENDITIYTDLIKVSVAMDNAQILGFDARGYIVNHHERNLTDKKISQDDAAKALSPMLNVEKSKLCLIPTESLNETLCYEFLCKGYNDQKILVYINATTGKEEQILILYNQGDSVLTL